MSDIRKGDVFRMFEPDGIPVTHMLEAEFVAQSDSYDFVEDGKLVASVDIAINISSGQVA